MAIEIRPLLVLLLPLLLFAVTSFAESPNYVPKKFPSATTDNLLTALRKGGRRSCVFRGTKRYHYVKIPASAYGTRGLWRRVGKTSIVYKPWSHSHRIDRPYQTSSVMYYKFTVPYNGHYRFIMLSKPAHNKEHNDLWVKFMMGGPTWIRRKYERSHRTIWGFIKVYTNTKGRWTFQTSTKDHDPHIIITPWLRKGRTYTFAISGRSTRLVIHSFYFYHCEKSIPNSCNSNGIHFRECTSPKAAFTRCV